MGALATLAREVAAWNRQRNATGERIVWMFNVGDARRKLGRSYHYCWTSPCSCSLRRELSAISGQR
jgi:hypothetical protein